MLHYHSELSQIDWNELATVIERAPLGKRDPAFVEKTFRGSHRCCFVEENGTLIGTGRAISDGASNSAIFDVVVLPEYQKRGIGKSIILYLLERLPTRSVLLVSVPQQEEFYRKLGFHKLKTAYLRHEEIERWISDGYIDSMPKQTQNE
ncbi:MAG: GNAT family N-acetyltransferase [Bacteroidetes bacterium]|nr:GNAT family N-acetyltransferase [Bacteroidota bacterium]MCW5897147.1 GNAT family N-acetyltransferase [Bacteroidota bacterium]